MSAVIRVVVAGHRGRVGQEVVRAVEAAPDLELAGGVGSADSLEQVLAGARSQVLVDFTRPEAALGNAMAAVAAGVAPVVGTSGLKEADLDQLEAACRERGVGGIVAPNFAIGAVLMMRLAEAAAPFFEGVEVIEAHHPGKADAPSGTALATARRLAQVRADRPFQRPSTRRLELEGVRGGELGGVGIHSIRLTGLVADQEVVLGLPGQTLTIAHRTTGREAFCPGVLLAIRQVVARPHFHRGLEALLVDG